MIRKIVAFVLLGSTAAAAAHAQAPRENESSEKVFSTFFHSDGGYLGIETAEITKENLAKYGLREVRGVAVDKVTAGSPAEAAGLQSGDVIVKFNGEDVTSVRKLTRLIGEVAPDHQVKLTVVRGGSEREMTATLGKRPAAKLSQGLFSMQAPGGAVRILPPGDLPNLQTVPGAPFENFNFRTGTGRQIGIGITPLTAQLAEHYNVSGGVLVNNVRENSPAAKAGLKAGDIIVEVDGRELKADNELIRAIADKKEGDVTLTFVRGGNRQTIRVTPEEVKGTFNQYFEFPEGSLPENFKLNVPRTPNSPPLPMNRLFFPGREL